MSSDKKKGQKYNSKKILLYTLLSGGVMPFLYASFFYSLTVSCAQQQQLQGGPRDTIPPKLIEALSTPNFQTNFEKQTIEQAFDEYIEIRNVVKQVVISPPLTYLPKVERKKGFKTAQFKFDEKEVLKEGVTYAINFGESIKDLTEGNTVKDLQFLFSTGDYIDSLKMKGSIVDALTGEPVPDALFMLYQNFADTVVRTEKPYYFGKTDKEGNFTINYLKAGIFKGFALEDQDLNYLFNIPSERIGFTLDSIKITDSMSTEVQIRLFEELTTLAKPKVDMSEFGLLKIGFKRPPYEAIISYDTIGQELYQEVEGDTMRYWYHYSDTLNWNIYIQRDTIVDTFSVRPIAEEKRLPIALSRVRDSKDKIAINPFKSLPLSFNHPMKAIDTALINFRLITVETKDTSRTGDIDTLGNQAIDSLTISKTDSLSANSDSTLVSLEQKGPRIAADFQIDSLSKRILRLDFPWEEDLHYQLELLPGAITDWYNEANPDTILLNYEVKPKNDFGNINLTVTEMDSSQQYWFQLLLGENVVDTFSVNNATSFSQSFPALVPGNYSLKVIEDLNGNSRWDAGNYDKKLQPEKISVAKIEELRAGWDVEAEVKIDFSKKQKTEN